MPYYLPVIESDASFNCDPWAELSWFNNWCATCLYFCLHLLWNTSTPLPSPPPLTEHKHASASASASASTSQRIHQTYIKTHIVTHQTDDRPDHIHTETQHVELQTYRRTRLDHTTKLWEEEERYCNANAIMNRKIEST